MAQQTLGPALANCIQCPRAQPGAGTPSPGSEEERSRVHLYLFICCLKLLARGCGCEFPHVAGVRPGQALPCSQPLPGLGRWLGARSMENPGDHRSKKRDLIRRLLLFLTGAVPTHCHSAHDRRAGPQDDSKEVGERQGWQGAQAPPAS